jgi:hypothetical protein
VSGRLRGYFKRTRNKSERFVETARKLGVDENDEKLDFMVREFVKHLKIERADE